MSEKLKILVICRHNAGRSQMVAAYLQRLGGNRVDVDSAGLEAGDSVNPLVVEVMREDGFDLANKKPQRLLTLSESGRTI